MLSDFGCEMDCWSKLRGSWSVPATANIHTALHTTDSSTTGLEVEPEPSAVASDREQAFRREHKILLRQERREQRAQTIRWSALAAPTPWFGLPPPCRSSRVGFWERPHFPAVGCSVAGRPKRGLNFVSFMLNSLNISHLTLTLILSCVFLRKMQICVTQVNFWWCLRDKKAGKVRVSNINCDACRKCCQTNESNFGLFL